jgi:glycerol kinase
LALLKAMPTYLLALDQGTTSSRAALFDDAGALVGLAGEEFPQSYPRPGWVEHDPEAIWDSQLRAARRVLVEVDARAESIRAVGITNQRETTLVWERATGRPIHPAIVWQCRRTAARCDSLRAAGKAELLRAKTGLVLDAYFSGTKLEWLLDHVPDARARAERGELCFGTVDTFLLWRLTAGRVHATDPSNASRTLLYNLHTRDWDDEILSELRIPRAMLPEVRPSSGLFGETDPALFGRAIPIAGIAGDQQAALFGQACYAPGMAKNTYGTGCFLLANAGDQPPHTAEGLLATVAWQLSPGDATNDQRPTTNDEQGQPRDARRPTPSRQAPDDSCPVPDVGRWSLVVGRMPASSTAYAIEGSVFIAGAAVQWLRDGLGLIGSAAETEALANSVPDTGGVYFVPAFVGLGAPYWDAYARGTLVGLTRGTTRAHIVRATLDAICLQTCDVVDAMTTHDPRPTTHDPRPVSEIAPSPRRPVAPSPLSVLRVDGGGAANNFLLQRQADLLGVPVERPVVRETTALGAAYLAGLATGVWGSLTEVAACWRHDRHFEPRLDASAREETLAAWRRAVERARGWASPE